MCKDIQMLEKVQQAATKIVACLKNFRHEDRLYQLGLTSTVTRRWRGDLIETFKIMTGRKTLDKISFSRSQPADMDFVDTVWNLQSQDVVLTCGSILLVIWNGSPDHVVICQCVQEPVRQPLVQHGNWKPRLTAHQLPSTKYKKSTNVRETKSNKIKIC